MPANAFVRRGGALVRTSRIFVRSSGAWIPAANGFIRRGGAWVQFYNSESSFTVTVGSETQIITRYGYAAGDPPISGSSGFGSRSPTSAFNQTITGLWWPGGSSIVNFALADSTLGSGFISEIQVVGFGTDSSLTYSNSSGDSVWTGDVGTNLPLSGSVSVIVKR